MAYFRPRDAGKNQGYDIHWLWFAVGMATIFWVVLSEPKGYSNLINLEHLPWAWAPALSAWGIFCSAFRACQIEDVEAWNDLDSGTFGRVALATLWRFAIWAGITCLTIFVCGKLGLSYDAATTIIIVVAVVNAIVGVLRRPPESLWD